MPKLKIEPEVFTHPLSLPQNLVAMGRVETKVSGITSLTDARYCAGMGVHYLGILFDENGQGNVERNAFVSISGWIEGPRWVGEYEGNDYRKVLELAENYGLTLWQINSFELADQLLAHGLDVGLKMSAADFLQRYSAKKDRPIAFVQLENMTQELDQELWQKLTATHQTFLVRASSPRDLTFIQQTLSGAGVCLLSGMEERPGWMDLSGLQDILEMIENE